MADIRTKVCNTCKRNLGVNQVNFEILPKGLFGFKDICRDCESRKKLICGSGSKDRIKNKYKTRKSISKDLAEDLYDL